MYDVFLRLIREEIGSDKITLIHPAKIQEYESFIKNNMGDLIYMSKDSKKLFNKVLENIVYDAELLIRLRLAKKSLGSDHPDEAIDKFILDKINSIVDFAKLYISKFLLGTGDKLIVKCKKECYVENRKYMPGDIVFMKAEKALINYIEGNIELFINPYLEQILHQ
ncbi:hypothetical protein Smar_0640 [Staphylothermus marinus F1]|uniref:Uncharacterized protein n=1 Tax=Staphylothermus marinus (strain ATCC 43588 / DSM 3639 / JCM 9404 / F1) TaxID=399550 RepID=A3DM86_STAMF|nr:hypothetical protein [Staphylothermus marinus]ABN69746.1 hypothetical protein Smar_0640 [Staphylothermus marinus F1]